MRKDLDIWNFTEDALSRGVPVMLLVVAESSGSSPGRPGFKMAVSSGDMCGSIGGGVMEVSLVERARELLKSENPTASDPVRQVHRMDCEDSSGMICSGEQTVIVRKFAASDLSAVRECIASLKKGLDHAVWISPGFFQAKPASNPDRIRFDFKPGGEYLFVEEMRTVDELVIIGGGHCALALSELMARMDFRIILYDDRPALNTLIKNGFAHEINIIEDYATMGEIVESGDNRYVVVMTIGYKYDKVVVSELLDKEFKYFGVLGSKAKMAVLLRELKDEGMDADRLDAIRTPIGLDINSRTPFEIAVSIAAEIIAMKNGGKV